MKCYACKEGNISTHGCFNYCDQCNFSSFVMTNDYISSCAALMGTLVSNTRFSTMQSWTQALSDYMFQHMPILADYVNAQIADVDARSKFMMSFADEVITHAINIELPEGVMQHHSATAYKRDTPGIMTCVGCGSTNLILDSNRPIATCECGVSHEVVEGSHLEPLFKCNCGSIRHEVIDELLAKCSNCAYGYMHQNGINFKRL